MGARETALNALMACRQSGAWPNAILKDYIARDGLDARDAGLATRLCYGVLQNRAKLDFYLEQLLTGKRKRLHPVIRDILHLGLYQLLELDKIPERAAVNESVALAKKYHAPQAPLVNGVLRAAVRQRGELKEPISYADRYSHPDALITLLKSALPKGELEPMLTADNTAPQTAVQLNPRKATLPELEAHLQGAGVRTTRHAWMPDCLILEHTGNLERLKAFQNGEFYVQDPASKLAALWAELTPGKVLDCCAAPGGKSFAAAIAMGGLGQVTACDIHPHKAALIEKGAARLGLNVTAQVRDAAQPCPEWAGQFDAVLVDVPCSGLGIIRKKPDIRYKPIEELAKLPPLQGEILDNQSNYVRPGGVLIYSTCTVLPQENQQVVEGFLAGNPDFSLENPELPDNFPKPENGMLTLLPGKYDTDGFFICRLRRKL